MAAGPHTYMLGNVFNAERFQGQRFLLMAVHGDAFSIERKLQITRELQCTTGFLHDAIPGQARRLEMFKQDGEIMLDGGAVLGAVHAIFQRLERLPPPNTRPHLEGKILTRAGELDVFFNDSRHVSYAEIPHKYQVMSEPASTSQILNLQPQLQSFPNFAELPDFFPVVSIIETMEYPLIDFSNHINMLEALIGTPPPLYQMGGEKTKSTAIFFAVLASEVSDGLHYHNIRVRTLKPSGVEEAACGTGACTLAVHLALQIGGASSHHVFAIEQGVEVDRKSQICVEVKFGPDGREITSVRLSGRSTFTFRGEYMGAY